MPTLFPGAFDVLPNPAPTDKTNVFDHAGSHSNANDAIEALEAKVGIDGSAVQTSHDFKLSAVTGASKAIAENKAWPVGAVFISVVNTNPATLLGFGTWSAFGAGRVLVGFNASDTDFDTAEETGGAKTVASSGTVSQPTFTGSALATHSHELPFQKVAGGTGLLGMLAPTIFGTGTSRARESQSAAPTANTTSAAVLLSEAKSAGTPAGTVSQPTFSGAATSVVQPYVTAFFWKRTA